MEEDSKLDQLFDVLISKKICNGILLFGILFIIVATVLLYFDIIDSEPAGSALLFFGFVLEFFGLLFHFFRVDLRDNVF